MRRLPLLVASTAVILAATLTASLLAGNRKPATLQRPLDQIPMELGGWAGSPGPTPTDREFELLAATSFLSRNYRKAGTAVQLSIAYYAMQRAGESMHTPKNCLPGAGWEISDYDSAEIPLDGRLETINKFAIQNGDAKAVVLYWYQTRHRIIDSEYKGKAFLMWDAITTGRTEGSVVKILLPDKPSAIEDALGFAAAIMAEMSTLFGG
jgi:EpsI family protein